MKDTLCVRVCVCVSIKSCDLYEWVFWGDKNMDSKYIITEKFFYVDFLLYKYCHLVSCVAVLY